MRDFSLKNKAQLKENTKKKSFWEKESMHLLLTILITTFR